MKEKEKLASLLGEIFRRDNEMFSPELVADELMSRRSEWDGESINIMEVRAAAIVMSHAATGGVTAESMRYAANALQREIERVESASNN
jgi:hypothetical protein